MRGRMRIAANNRHPRQRQALLRADNVHNPLARVTSPKQTNAKLGAVALQRLHLRARNRVLNLALRVQRRHIMIRHRLNRIDPPRLAPGKTQTVKRLRRSHLMNQMTVNIKQCLPVRLAHHMRLPDLVIQRLPAHNSSCAHKSANDSRRRINRACPPSINTSAGRGREL